MTILHLSNIKKSYKLSATSMEQVLKGVDLSIARGKMTAIFGPSGCGKTSLLNILSGMDRDYEGQVSFEGQSLTGLSEQELTAFRKEHIGFVFQNFNLIPHQSVLDNVKLPLYLTDLSEKEMVKRVEETLDGLGILALKDKNVTQLSGGQKQRVAIARALVNQAELIVADEPTGSLDSKSQEAVLEIFKTLTEQGKTVVIVTHNPEVSEYAHVVIKMKDGDIIETSQA